MKIQNESITTPISEKVAYVKSQRQTRLHECHWEGCTKQCPPAMWGCKEHWFRLPKNLRDIIWRTYCPGQEKDLSPSAEYIEAAKTVRAWILNQHSKPQRKIP